MDLEITQSCPPTKEDVKICRKVMDEDTAAEYERADHNDAEQMLRLAACRSQEERR
jgi:hypothetical protein